MREIKFRGQRLSDKKWVEGSLSVMPKESYRIHSYYIRKNGTTGRHVAFVDPRTIGQLVYPGDQLHSPIYEGDVVGFSSTDDRYTVVFQGVEPYALLDDNVLLEIETVENGDVYGNIHE